MHCPCCQHPSDTIERRRLNTAYCDPESNWLTSCEECFREAWDNFEEQWAEVISGSGCGVSYVYTPPIVE